jgi:hypothetical protein
MEGSGSSERIATTDSFNYDLAFIGPLSESVIDFT